MNEFINFDQLFKNQEESNDNIVHFIQMQGTLINRLKQQIEEIEQSLRFSKKDRNQSKKKKEITFEEKGTIF